MLKKATFKLIALALIILLAANSCEQQSQYEKEVQDFRAMKNENFTKPGSSPLAKDQLENFKGLQYFEINSNYKMEAQFIPAKIQQYVRLFDSDDVKQVHVISGTLHFNIDGTPLTLLAYSSAGRAPHSLFIPFSDTHKNSYPGGRYVDGKLMNDSTCLIDFNLSYNPYCVYNELYKCALVPKKNKLKVAVPAGEKWENSH